MGVRLPHVSAGKVFTMHKGVLFLCMAIAVVNAAVLNTQTVSQVRRRFMQLYCYCQKPQRLARHVHAATRSHHWFRLQATLDNNWKRKFWEKLCCDTWFALGLRHLASLNSQINSWCGLPMFRNKLDDWSSANWFHWATTNHMNDESINPCIVDWMCFLVNQDVKGAVQRGKDDLTQTLHDQTEKMTQRLALLVPFIPTESCSCDF